MDRLVKPDVKEVALTFTRGQKCTTTFRLSNLMHTMSVAVSLSTTNPSLSFPQPFSILPPLSTSSFSLILFDPPDHPPLSSPPDFVTVRTPPSPSPSSAPTSSISFSPSNTKTLEVAFLLSKAISSCDESDLTSLLRSAAQSGNSYFVSALIDAGADLNNIDYNVQSVMSLAIQSGNIDSVRILIDSGFVIDNSIDWLLHDVAAIDRSDLMEVLCLGFREIVVNLVDFRGRTALHVAAICRHVDSLQFLVSIGGDPDLMDHNGWTPLHCEAAEFLIDHSTFSKYAVTREGKTSFALAVEKGHSHLYDLLQLGDSLQRAARLDDIHAMKSCLAEDGRVNGWTPLHRAAFKGRVESVKLLLSHGA
ncbi:hypothetical protein Acr_28g0001920 [Actinidia rufa]|uniref:Ankyrin repeat family protein n=1 Tax=Actinidia rufa TaxID=165716 RepID=A0A7J0H8Q8_9ERIC|nr:hypothetical protein Acr_28g0001920 [Actinidia rufa]